MDSSVLVAIARREPDYERDAEAMLDKDAVLGAPTRIVLSDLLARLVDELFDRLRHEGRGSIVDFTPAMAAAAFDAFRRYGEGRRHPARLNFGDCLSYAVAKTQGIPLLFKGGDFALTDIEPAPRP